MFIITGSMIIPAIWPGWASRTRRTASRRPNGTTCTRSATSVGTARCSRTVAGWSGSPKSRASGYTDTCTASWWPWYDPSTLMRWVRPVTARIRWIAAIVDSVPEFVKRHSGRPKRRASSAATGMMSGVGWAKWVPCVTRSVTARTIAGWPWPASIVPKPPWRSTYSVPSTSHTRLPAPRSRKTGHGGASCQDEATPPGRCSLAATCSSCDRRVRSISVASWVAIRRSRASRSPPWTWSTTAMRDHS